MGILFLILKILGILLAVFLLLAAAVVAFPVRYRISLEIQEKAQGEAVFHWLFHAVYIRLCYGEEGFLWKCRILGIPMFPRKRQGGGGRGKRKKRKAGTIKGAAPTEGALSGEEAPSKKGAETKKDASALGQAKAIKKAAAFGKAKTGKEEALREGTALGKASMEEAETGKEEALRGGTETGKEAAPREGTEENKASMEEVETGTETALGEGTETGKEPAFMEEAESLEETGAFGGLISSKEQAKRRVIASIQKQKEELMEFQREQPSLMRLKEQASYRSMEGGVQEQEGEILPSEIEEQSAGQHSVEGEQWNRRRSKDVEEEPSKGQGSKDVEGEPSKGQGSIDVEGERSKGQGSKDVEGEPSGGQHSEDGGSKRNLFGRLKLFFLKIPQWFQALRSWAANMGQKIASLKVRFKNIKSLVLEETNQKAFLHVLLEVKTLLRHYAPRQAVGKLEFCMGDPAQTGEVLGAVSLIPFWARYQVAVLPDFMGESFYIKGTFCCKGYIRAWHFLPSFVRLMKDKNIHRLVAAIRK